MSIRDRIRDTTDQMTAQVQTTSPGAALASFTSGRLGGPEVGPVGTIGGIDRQTDGMVTDEVINEVTETPQYFMRSIRDPTGVRSAVRTGKIITTLILAFAGIYVLGQLFNINLGGS